MDEIATTNLDKMLPPVQPVDRNKPKIIIVGAYKGGVGKTTVSRLLLDLFTHRAIPHVAYDCEKPDGDLVKFVPTAKVVDILDVNAQMEVFDNISGLTVLDLQAATLIDLLKDLERARVLADVRAGRLDMVLLHVLDSNLASLEEVSKLTALLGGVKHILVKNLRAEGGFDEWTKDPRFADALRLAADRTITIPHLEERAMVQMQTEVPGMPMGFRQYATLGKSRMARGYVADWLDAAWAEFGRIGIGA
jgi:hypothetical protein